MTRPTRLPDGTPEVDDEWGRWYQSLTPEQKKVRGIYTYPPAD